MNEQLKEIAQILREHLPNPGSRIYFIGDEIDGLPQSQSPKWDSD